MTILVRELLITALDFVSQQLPISAGSVRHSQGDKQ